MKYPKIQILTVKELLDGKRPELPMTDTDMWKRPKEEDNYELFD